mmetsp:Transcript_28036/g.94120  ORF Transcript_28036/g.94120 Transcript_28036/m.94120 type:complete len:293 (+) Transcript_28036:1454-2332(+)
MSEPRPSRRSAPWAPPSSGRARSRRPPWRARSAARRSSSSSPATSPSTPTGRWRGWTSLSCSTRPARRRSGCATRSSSTQRSKRGSPSPRRGGSCANAPTRATALLATELAWPTVAVPVCRGGGATCARRSKDRLRGIVSRSNSSRRWRPRWLRSASALAWSTCGCSGGGGTSRASSGTRSATLRAGSPHWSRLAAGACCRGAGRCTAPSRAESRGPSRGRGTTRRGSSLRWGCRMGGTTSSSPTCGRAGRTRQRRSRGSCSGMSKTSRPSWTWTTWTTPRGWRSMWATRRP